MIQKLYILRVIIVNVRILIKQMHSPPKKKSYVTRKMFQLKLSYEKAKGPYGTHVLQLEVNVKIQRSPFDTSFLRRNYHMSCTSIFKLIPLLSSVIEQQQVWAPEQIKHCLLNDMFAFHAVKFFCNYRQLHENNFS